MFLTLYAIYQDNEGERQRIDLIIYLSHLAENGDEITDGNCNFVIVIWPFLIIFHSSHLFFLQCNRWNVINGTMSYGKVLARSKVL